MDALVSFQNANGKGLVFTTPSKISSSPETQPGYNVQAPVSATRSSKQITRNRASYSCHTCRRRKVKCDKVHPVCGQCVKTGCECVFDNTQPLNGSSGIPSNGVGKIDSSNNGSAVAHQDQEDSIMEFGIGHKRRRTSNSMNEDYLVPAGGFTHQDGILPKTFDIRGSLAPSGTGPEDIETRLSRLSEIVGRYTGDPVGYSTADPRYNPQVSVWTPGENLSPVSTSENSARNSFNRRSTSESVSSASRSIRPRNRENQNRDGLYSSPSSSDSEDPVRKSQANVYSSTPGKENLNSYILQQSLDPKSTRERYNESGESSSLPYAGRNERLPRTKEDHGLGPSNGNHTLHHHDEQGKQSHPALGSDPIGDLAIGHLSLEEGGQSRFISNTFWAYVGNEISELNNLLREQSRSRAVLPVPIGPEQTICPSMKGTFDDQSYSAAAAGDTGGPSGDIARPKPASEFHSPNTCPAGSRALEVTIAQNLGSSLNSVYTGHTDKPPTGDAHRPSSPMHEDVTDKANLLKFDDRDDATRFFSLLPGILKELPTKEQCAVLYRGFMTGVHPIIPLIHPPRFNQDYLEFWEWMEKPLYKEHELCPTSILGRSPSFLPLIFAVLYGGSISLSPKELNAVLGSIPKANLNEKLYNATTRALGIVSFPRASAISSLSAFMIVQTLMIREEQPLESCMFIGLAMRVAQTMGLHRDGSHFGMDPVDAEVRRRVWWHILHMDVMTALASGLPPLMYGEGLDDTRPISELKDEYIGTPEGIEYECAVAEGRRPPDTPDDPIVGTKTSMTAVCYVLAAGRYVESTIVRKLLGKILGVKPLSSKDMQEMGDMLGELRTKMDERIGRIPTRGLPEMGFTPEVDAEFGLPPQDSAMTGTNVERSAGDNEWQLRCDEEKLIAFHAWSRIVLSLLVDKAFCVIYQPVLKNAKSKIWIQARQCALRHCHSFLRKFIHLSTARVFQPFRWCYPGTYQPMHATMILLVDLYERPTAPEAPRSRAFIDEIFSLFGQDGGIVSSEDGVTIQRPLREGGREAWCMLARLRHKTWEKAGLDPDILWTEARQKLSGVEKPLTRREQVLRRMREGTLGNVPIVNGSTTAKETRSGTAPPIRDDTPQTAAQLDMRYGIFGEPTLSPVPIDQVFTDGSGNVTSVLTSNAVPSQVAGLTPMLKDDVYLNSCVENLVETLFEGPAPGQTGMFCPDTTAAAAAVPVGAPPPPTQTQATPAAQPPEQIRKADPEPVLKPEPQLQESSPLDDMEIKPDDFDWDEWDMVFGKFVSLEDLMDLDAETTDFSKF